HYCLTMYEQTEGMFPTRAQGAANAYTNGDAQEALQLLYRQYTDDVRIFSCPSKPMTKTVLDTLVPSTSASFGQAGGTLKENATVGGQSPSYGSPPAHNSSANSRVIVAADHAGNGGANAQNPDNSDNHGKSAGQNMLSAGGSVVFNNV